MSSIYYDIAIFSTYRLVIDILLSQRVRMKLKLSSNFICRHLKDVMHRFKLYLILHSQNRQNPENYPPRDFLPILRLLYRCIPRQFDGPSSTSKRDRDWLLKQICSDDLSLATWDNRVACLNWYEAGVVSHRQTAMHFIYQPVNPGMHRSTCQWSGQLTSVTSGWHWVPSYTSTVSTHCNI